MSTTDFSEAKSDLVWLVKSFHSVPDLPGVYYTRQTKDTILLISNTWGFPLSKVPRKMENGN